MGEQDAHIASSRMAPERAGQFGASIKSDGVHLAFAPPYGPPLRGGYGRPAGSVADFSYSRAFKRALHRVVWNSETLDAWIADSQKRALGALMFYKQPDPQIRRQRIAY